MFAVFHFQPSATPYAFQFEQGHQHSLSQTSAGQHSSEKIQLLSRRLLDLICVRGTFFSFQFATENPIDVADSGGWESGSLS